MHEVIGKGSLPANRILFHCYSSHGGYHAVGVGMRHFLDYFADKGFRAVAVSPHGTARAGPIQATTFVLDRRLQGTMFALPLINLVRKPYSSVHPWAALAYRNTLRNIQSRLQC